MEVIVVNVAKVESRKEGVESRLESEGEEAEGKCHTHS